MYSFENRGDFEKLNELVLIKVPVKASRLLDKLRKQKFHEDMKKTFEPNADTVKKTARETIGGVKDETGAIELKGGKTNKAINEIEKLRKYAISFGLRILGPLSEVDISKNTR